MFVVDLCDDELYTLTELHNKLGETALGDEEQIYSKKQLKRKLVDKYGDHIVFTEVAGKRNVICFQNMAECVINDKWYSQRESDIEDERLRVVTAAAKLIKDQIREMECDMEKYRYPVITDFGDLESSRQWIPTLLTALMQNIVCDERKQVALSHCVVQAARPRSVIAPIPFGLGVSLDHTFGSKWLLSILAVLDLCVSYDEVTRYIGFAYPDIRYSDIQTYPLILWQPKIRIS